MIAIIAILAAILFPVFAKAREKARQTACLSNMKQVGLALPQYCQDNDYLVPPDDIRDGFAARQGYIMAARMQPSAKNFQIFKCPSSTTAEGTAQEVQVFYQTKGTRRQRTF